MATENGAPREFAQTTAHHPEALVVAQCLSAAPVGLLMLLMMGACREDRSSRVSPVPTAESASISPVQTVVVGGRDDCLLLDDGAWGKILNETKPGGWLPPRQMVIEAETSLRRRTDLADFLSRHRGWYRQYLGREDAKRGRKIHFVFANPSCLQGGAGPGDAEAGWCSWSSATPFFGNGEEHEKCVVGKDYFLDSSRFE